MDINSAFPSKFLKAADLGGRRVAVTITEVVVEDIEGEDKPIVYFQGKKKGLVLNKTNANMIADITGTSETDDWTGKKIVLYPTKTDFQGRRVDAIRVDFPTSDQQPTPPPQRPAKAEAEDDEVPW